MNIEDTKLPKKLKAALIEQGIEDLETLCRFDLDAIGELEGVGAVALVQLAKLRDTYRGNAVTETKSGSVPDAGETTKKYMTEEPPEELRTPDGKKFEVSLKFRHAEWVEEMARLTNATTAQIIEQCVRQVFSKDATKAGKVIESGTVLQHDNPYKQ